MFRPRIIALLLISNNELVKSIGFQNHRYVGDPINAARLFSEMKADELMLLDINASRKQMLISPEIIQKISNETNMPFAAGGGIKSCADIEKLINAGAEKVVIGTSAYVNPGFIEEAAKEFGSSTISVCIDLFKLSNGEYSIRYKNAEENYGNEVKELCTRFEELGAGELIIQSVNNDGLRSGYDTELIRLVAENVQIPVVALGGAGNLNDLKTARENGASALAAGSMFVFHRNGILINYPERHEIDALFSHS